MERRHSAIYKRVKSLLPRRESERRAHRLSRHCDILSALETRISMLNMTFSKFIECQLCYFIPGKVNNTEISIKKYKRNISVDIMFHRYIFHWTRVSLSHHDA